MRDAAENPPVWITLARIFPPHTGPRPWIRYDHLAIDLFEHGSATDRPDPPKNLSAKWPAIPDSPVTIVPNLRTAAVALWISLANALAQWRPVAADHA